MPLITANLLPESLECDVVLTNQGGSLAFHINIKASKTDQFHGGVRYFWLALGLYIYPVQPLLDNYLPFNALTAFNYLLQ